jgi:hypothetical protein
MEEFDDLLKEPDESGYLDLSHRAWSTLDDVLWTWGQQLIVLNVSFNNVKTISEGIGELVLLREFDISCNSLEELPDEIGNCARLKKIRLNGNRLKALPDTIGNCKMLEELIVSENALDLLPATIGNIPTLRVLKAANNHLREVEPTVCQCLALEDIDVQGNDTANVPNQLRANTAMIIWLCRRDRDQRQLVADLEHTIKELESSARHQDVRKVQLQDQIKVLEKDKQRLQDEMPTTYLKWSKRAGNISKVCAIQ